MNYSFNFYLLKTLFGSLTLNIWLPTSFEWKVIYLKKIKSIAQYSCFHWWPWNRFSTWGFNCRRVGFFLGLKKKDTKSIYGPTESYTTGNPVKSYVTTRATTCHQDKRNEGNQFAFDFFRIIGRLRERVKHQTVNWKSTRTFTCSNHRLQVKAWRFLVLHDGHR